MKRFSDILLSSKIVFLFGACIGVIGNANIIFFYFFRIKERGERYFIPLLGIVDLLGCLFLASFSIMDNDYVFNFKNVAACKIVAFLQICIPAISAHTLLIISIQRYRLVCKPLCPKMTLRWKRVSFGIVCFVSVAYSAPVLATADIFSHEILYHNHNVTQRKCNFSFKRSISMRNYFIFVLLIMVVNLVTTAGLYIPILKQLSSFFSKTVKYKKYNNKNVDLQLATSQEEKSSKLEIDNIEMPASFNELQETDLNFQFFSSPKAVGFNEHVQNAVVEHVASCAGHTASNIDDNVVSHKKPLGNNNKFKLKTGSAQKRISFMFFFLIVAYVLSYIPPLIILILIYTSDALEPKELTNTEMAVQTYLLQLVFLNHIVNPFIYGVFDTEFKKQLGKYFRRQKS